MGRKVAVKASKMNSTADLNDDTDPSHNINTNTNTNTNTSSNTGTNTNTSTNTNTNNNTDANTNTNTSTNTSTSTSTNTHTSTSTDTSTETNADTNADADADSGAVEILPYLFLGPRSAAASEPFIRARGITHVLSIGASPPRPALPGVVYTRVPMLDSPSLKVMEVRIRGCSSLEGVDSLPGRKEERVRLFEECERAHDDNDEEEEEEEEWGLKKIEEDAGSPAIYSEG
ncbi:hypothetical protein A7U60_g6559 [Sanghuangporus baumii]|uniref:Uncharacterized protein n=1 Tax=Sanghuangporus baumii TaxID=108892 RepID=A0A9Q5HUV5_SANBA|nr:hypothetical protein A7U60_g6559 [Sanghuangporus baumii]